jgi:hypothetical protein
MMVTELMAEAKLTDPVAVPVDDKSIALPPEALVSVITLPPAGSNICSASKVAIGVPAAKVFHMIYPPTAANITATINKWPLEKFETFFKPVGLFFWLD